MSVKRTLANYPFQMAVMAYLTRKINADARIPKLILLLLSLVFTFVFLTHQFILLESKLDLALKSG